MRVAELTDTQTIVIGERERPTPSGDEILVSVQACGVCTTDYHMYAGSFDVDFPTVPGHESAGAIVEVGPDVGRFEPGDRVAINPSIPCNECQFCKTGSENQCSSLTSVGGVATNIVDGAFAEYVLVPAGNVESIENLSYRDAAFAEPLGCCLQGIDQLEPTTGDTAVLVGAGPIGLLFVQLLRLHGVGRIVVSEPLADRREQALEMGADHVIDPGAEDVGDAVEAYTESVDLVVEAVGSPRTLTRAFDLVGPDGRLLVFGVPPKDATIEISPFEVFYNEIAIVGTYSLTPGTFARAVRLLEAERVDVEPLVTGECSLDEIQDAFDRIEAQEGLKQMVYPGE